MHSKYRNYNKLSCYVASCSDLTVMHGEVKVNKIKQLAYARYKKK